MDEISEYLETLKIGPMQQHRNMSVLPLLGKDSGLEYLVLDEALESGLKIGETRHVPELRFGNGTGKEVLILMGEYVVGGWQNRMVARNVYMAKDFDGMVPVKCVQQHRWGGPEVDLPIEVGPGTIRRTPVEVPNWMPSQFSSSSKRVAPSVMYACSSEGQGGVWNQISYLMEDMGVRSSTHNIGDLYKEKRHDLEEFMAGFKCVPGCVGFVVGLSDGKGGQRYSMELFDQGRTMGKHFQKLVESYALEAIAAGKEGQQPSGEALAGFLDYVRMGLKPGECVLTVNEPVSLGKDVDITGKKFEGSALIHNGVPVYATFCSEKRKKSEGGPSHLPGIRIARRPWEPEPPRDFPPYETDRSRWESGWRAEWIYRPNIWTSGSLEDDGPEGFFIGLR